MTLNNFINSLDIESSNKLKSINKKLCNKNKIWKQATENWTRIEKRFFKEKYFKQIIAASLCIIKNCAFS